MAAQKLITIKEFCVHHKIAHEFIHDLHRNEMIELVTVKRTAYIPEKNLHQLEKIIRLYNDLQINLEGIQTIIQLLQRLDEKEAEIRKLRNDLEFYG